MLFLRERHRNNQMMELMRAFMEEVTEQRRQEVEARREAEERDAEERRQVSEERRQAATQAAAQQEAFLEALNRLTEAIAQNGRGSQ